MSRQTLIEENLKRAQGRWRWLRFLRVSAILGTIVCLVFLAGGVAILNGWTPPPVLVGAASGAAIMGALIGFGIGSLLIFNQTPPRALLAGLLERGEPRLLDRVHTAVYLEKRTRRDPLARSFYQRIVQQAQGLLARQQPPIPLSSTKTRLYVAGFFLVLFTTSWWYDRYDPWSHLKEARRQSAAKTPAPEAPELPPDLSLPETNAVEQKQAWGEIRITEPGRDLQVTKVDVVPLQIEAAASEPILDVGWLNSLNGQPEQPQALPPPPDPRYAVYQPTFYLDELGLSDWDVVTYYAKAATQKSNTYASEVFFLEIRPFREDILKLPGGERGPAYQCLNELTSLISQQRHVIRQTHQFLQRPDAPPAERQGDRDKLAGAEEDLSLASRHLYARMAGEMEHAPIGEALDALARADKDLAQAGALMRRDKANEAQSPERTALADLVAARKIFQKAVSEHPERFEDEKEEESPPVLAGDTNQLRQIAEFRNESEAVQDFVAKAVSQQKELAQRAARDSRTTYPKLAKEEQRLRESLTEFRRQHPAPFRDLAPETTAAEQALAEAARQLEQLNSGAKTNTLIAAQKLDGLRQALHERRAGRELANAYRLKAMLDRQITELEDYEKAAGNVSSEKLRETAGEARETVRQLKQTTSQSPTREAFGPKLHEALNQQNLTGLDGPLTELETAQTPDQKLASAGRAKEKLGQISRAFEESQPPTLQAARSKDSLQPGAAESLELGLDQLENLLRQLREGRPRSAESQAKQGREALLNLQLGLREREGSNERSEQILLRLEQALKNKEQPLELENLQKLMDELRRFSLELAEQRTKTDQHLDAVNLDPSRLPPAYRGRIEKYFQSLSEKR